MTLAVEVRCHCVMETFVVYIAEEIFESSMESTANFFASRVYAGASWDVVVPLVSVMTPGRAVERNWALRNDSLNTVLGRYACSAREIHLMIQQCEHAPIRQGPRVVWHNWRWLYDEFFNVLTTVVTNVGGTALPRSVVRFPDCSTGVSVVINCCVPPSVWSVLSNVTLYQAKVPAEATPRNLTQLVCVCDGMACL